MWNLKDKTNKQTITQKQTQRDRTEEWLPEGKGVGGWAKWVKRATVQRWKVTRLWW